MKIGVISDTHDNIYAIREAVKIFNREEVSEVLHAGDIISPFTVKEFGKLYCPITFILGNNDGDILHLKKNIKELNFNFSGRFYHGVINKKRIAMVHGEPPVAKSLINSKLYDIVISGHTHKKNFKRNGEVLHVNPGEACGYLTGKRTIAIIDMDKSDVKFMEI